MGAVVIAYKEDVRYSAVVCPGRVFPATGAKGHNPRRRRSTVSYAHEGQAAAWAHDRMRHYRALRAEAARAGWPEEYTGDLEYHDLAYCHRRDSAEPFGWVLRRYGTFAVASGGYEAAAGIAKAFGADECRWYFWDGRVLIQHATAKALDEALSLTVTIKYGAERWRKVYDGSHAWSATVTVNGKPFRSVGAHETRRVAEAAAREIADEEAGRWVGDYRVYVLAVRS